MKNKKTSTFIRFQLIMIFFLSLSRVIYAEECKGITLNCDQMGTNFSQCQKQKGCQWFVGGGLSYCAGVVSECNELSDKGSCDNQDYCSWEKPSDAEASPQSFLNSYQGAIHLYKTSEPFIVTGTVKAAFCKSGSPSFGSCDYPGIPMHVKVENNSGRILFSGEMKEWMTKRYNHWFKVTITVDKERISEGGTVMYIHIF